MGVCLYSHWCVPVQSWVCACTVMGVCLYSHGCVSVQSWVCACTVMGVCLYSHGCVPVQSLVCACTVIGVGLHAIHTGVYMYVYKLVYKPAINHYLIQSSGAPWRRRLTKSLRQVGIHLWGVEERKISIKGRKSVQWVTLCNHVKV